MNQSTLTDCPEENPALRALLSDLIAERGGISFAHFMEQCLYHPEYGYYTSARTRIGKEGDFFTSSSVHALFGRLIARQLDQMWQLLGCGEFTVAEQGAGEGHLCGDILDAAAEEFPDFYACLNYRIIEISPDHQQRQAANLTSHLRAGRVEWCSFDDLQGMQGCFLTNELVDAFPVHLVEKRAGEVLEVFVVNGDQGFAEELRPPSTARIADYHRLVGLQPAEGNRSEVNLAALDWMKEVAATLSRGFVMTIDYGHQAEELMAPYRKTGTLLCYHRHQTSEDPFQRVGCQDITAHIDFTALQRIGEQQGLRKLYFGEQYRFLMGLGFFEALVELQAREPDPQKAQALRMTLKNLILPEGGMGESFKILVQGKDVGAPELLCSRKIRDIGVPAGMF
ncbi:MAG: SAM-dependent methyltransferase [Desulfuromonadales bacterium]|nr:SAM-dependent methyltransferase [Desulfuromonadales bacterium]